MSGRYWIAGIALGLAIAASHAQEVAPEDQVAPSSAQEEPSDQSAVEEPSVTVPQIETTDPAAQPAENEQPSEETAQPGQKRNGGEGARWIILGDGFAQWIMAGSGIVAVGVSNWAVLLLKHTLIATRAGIQQARDGTHAAIIAAQVAQRQVDITEDTAKRQLRAYLSIKEAKSSRNDEERLVLQISFINAGQTPAYNVAVNITMHIHDVEDDFDYAVPSYADLPLRFGTIGPGRDFTVMRSRTETNGSEVEQWIKEGKTALVIYGEVLYDDAFDDPKATSFRIMYDAAAANSVDGTLSVCQEGNDAT
jgi:hypothetical protein